MKSITKSRSIFAAQVRKHRQAKGWRLEDLAHATGLSISYLSAMENSRANISLDNADSIANALGVALAVLLIDYGEDNSKKK